MAQEIVQVALAHCQEKKIRAIYLRIGALSGIAWESLQLYLNLILEEKNLDFVQVFETEIPPSFQCQCGQSYISSWTEGCPYCGSFQRTIQEGLDCQIESIEIEETSSS